MLQLRETTCPSMWMVVDLIDGSARAFSSQQSAKHYCQSSGRKFEQYCVKGLIR